MWKNMFYSVYLRKNYKQNKKQKTKPKWPKLQNYYVFTLEGSSCVCDVNVKEKAPEKFVISSPNFHKVSSFFYYILVQFSLEQNNALLGNRKVMLAKG